MEELRRGRREGIGNLRRIGASELFPSPEAQLVQRLKECFPIFRGEAEQASSRSTSLGYGCVATGVLRPIVWDIGTRGSCWSSVNLDSLSKECDQMGSNLPAMTFQLGGQFGMTLLVEGRGGPTQSGRKTRPRRSGEQSEQQFALAGAQQPCGAPVILSMQSHEAGSRVAVSEYFCSSWTWNSAFSKLSRATTLRPSSWTSSM